MRGIREWWGVWQAASLCCWWALVHYKALWEWYRAVLVGGAQTHRSPAVRDWPSVITALPLGLTLLQDTGVGRLTSSFQAELCGAPLVAGGRGGMCRGKMAVLPSFHLFLTALDPFLQRIRHHRKIFCLFICSVTHLLPSPKWMQCFSATGTWSQRIYSVNAVRMNE